MIEFSPDLLQKNDYQLKGAQYIFIYSPFCGTCHLARKMLDTIEAMWDEPFFYEMNAALHPNIMASYQIESVPCLLITKKGRVLRKIYAFHSVPYMYQEISKYD